MFSGRVLDETTRDSFKAADERQLFPAALVGLYRRQSAAPFLAYTIACRLRISSPGNPKDIRKEGRYSREKKTGKREKE